MDDTLMIETKNLTKSFGEFTAVDGIDLAVQRGTIHGFVGPNGAGKTTTMKMLIGAIWSTGGEGYIGGHRIGSLQAKQLIGYCPESASFYKDMVASDYLAYMAMVAGVERSKTRNKALELLDWLELGKYAETKVGGFSAGERQRLGLAQALIHDPQLLILDEPTANMDPTGRQMILGKLKQLSEEKKVTFFLSSHILSELEQVADFMTMIDHGRLVVKGEMTELKQSFSGKQFLIKTSDNDAMLEALKAESVFKESWIDFDGVIHVIGDDKDGLRKAIMAVTTRGIDIEYLSREQASLQDIYRKSVGNGGEEQE